MGTALPPSDALLSLMLAHPPSVGEVILSLGGLLPGAPRGSSEVFSQQVVQLLLKSNTCPGSAISGALGGGLFQPPSSAW